MEYIKGPTENGGAYAHIYFLDNNGQISDKDKGTNGYILEFDEKGNRIFETHFIRKGLYMPGATSTIQNTNDRNLDIEILDI